MDYEKKYNEALKRALNAADNGFVSQDFVSDIFPELAGSEDERIRKMLIHYFSDDDTTNGISNSSIRAYLEKQKEQNWSKEMGSLCLDAIGLLEDYGEGVAEDSPLGQKIKRANAFLVDLYHEAFYSKTYNPRPDLMYKPAEWHREDEQNLNVCLGYIKDASLRSWLIDAIHVRYDKPAEWSEEDKRNIDSAYYWLREYAGFILPNNAEKASTLYEIANRLKIVSEKSVLQVKHEWNDEEKNIIKILVELVEAYPERYFYDATKEQCYAWLKSFRPQPHWKPSEYTLSLVKKVAAGEMLTGVEQMAMGTLCEQLKSL